MSGISQVTLFVSIHPWCLDPARDEAVRAAEDNRPGPLPTLEEAIAAASPLPGRVEGTHWADWERLREERDMAIRERDTAIREREEFRRSFHWSEEAGTRLVDERDTALDDADGLRARVAELESQLESVACRAATAEMALESAPAASGAAGTEVVAWGVRLKQSMEVPPGCASPRRVGRKTFTQFFSTQDDAEAAAKRLGGTVVPLYADPQPARGWLTPEEREAIMYLIANRRQFAPQTPHEERRNAACRVCHALLARSTPPGPEANR